MCNMMLCGRRFSTPPVVVTGIAVLNDVIKGPHGSALSRRHTCAVCVASTGTAVTRSFTFETGKKDKENMCLYYSYEG
jgi:hypothetical protein